MNAGDWVAAAVGVVALLGVAWRLLRGLHRIVNIGEHLIERVGTLEKSLNNGLRGEVRAASDQAKKAQDLAAEAARTAAIAQQEAVEGRVEQLRAVNALRSEVDVYTNVVLTDRQRLHKALREAGVQMPPDSELDV